jgi:hypothetical protein
VVGPGRLRIPRGGGEQSKFEQRDRVRGPGGAAKLCIEWLLAAVSDILFITKRETRLVRSTEAVSTDASDTYRGPDERNAPPPGSRPDDAPADPGGGARG